MRRLLTTISVVSAVFALLASNNVDAARGALIMQIVDGVTVTVPPSGTPNPPNSYSYSSTSLAGFSNVTASNTFLPGVLSPAAGPGMDLGTNPVSASSGGTVQIWSTLTDLGASYPTAKLTWTFGLHDLLPAGATVTVEAWVNGDNTPFGTNDIKGTSGPVVLVSNLSPPLETSSGTLTNIPVTVGSPFSMTIEAVIVLPAGGSLSSGDFSARLSTEGGPQIQEGPEPASLAIWGMGLAMAAGVRTVRRRRMVA